MGRLKALPNLNPLFSGKYKTLFEEYDSKDYTKLLPEDSLQEVFTYNCNQCGHIQHLQVEDLNSLLGHAFRLAYTAHIQKAGDPLSNGLQSSLPNKLCTSKKTPDSSSSPVIQQTSPSNEKHLVCNSIQCSVVPSNSYSNNCSSHDSIESRYDHQRLFPVSKSVIDRQCCNHFCKKSSFNNNFSQLEKRFCRSSWSSSHRCIIKTKREKKHTSKLGYKYLRNPKSLSSQSSSGEMRTPTHMRHHHHLLHQSKDDDLSMNLLKPPSSLPGLHHDHENNILMSPDSDTNNSPTDMNTTRNLADKPPLIKNMNLSLESNLRLEQELNSVLSRNISFSGHSFNVTIPQSDTNVLSRLHDDLTIKKKKLSSSHNNLILRDHLTTPPPLPERSDSLTPSDEPHLKTAAWFQAGIPREIALEVLSREPMGAFMVRESTSKPGCYALSLRVPKDFAHSGIAHYLIVKSNKGYKIKGFTKEFCTLTALITHHSVMPELLPCPLSLHRYHPFGEEENSNEDSDYTTLSQFRKMMADLNV